MLEDVGDFAWVDAKRIGEILVMTHKKYRFESVLAMGRFRLYDVKDEPKLVDLQHLELEVGEKKWQGYLLPKGIPTSDKIRRRIIPTYELIPGVRGRSGIYDEMLEKAVVEGREVKVS